MTLLDLRFNYAQHIEMITKKQKAVLDYINHYQTENGISPTQKEIKEYFNLKSFGSVQRYLKYLKDAGLLTNEWNSRRGLKTRTDDQLLSMFPKIPVVGDIAAGNPIEAIEKCDEFINVPSSLVKSSGIHFGLNVNGDSMIEAGINDGDLAIIRSQATANNGEIIAAIIDGDATLKTLERKDNQIHLIPANSKYKPINVTGTNFTIAGILTGILRSY